MSFPVVMDGEKLPVISTNSHFCGLPSRTQQSGPSEQEEKEMRRMAEANNDFIGVIGFLLV
ncbi:hypothetical protein MB14_10470 [Roseivirga ehrenbergii]|uniref:Uncharacterized protein n=1 Tax=Roseivirga ehrenbergii (strain DSM 102268 / JCM 13514 / KCTC 12282 / NCIMB 14502 / KMM 6017) TaxID=279360 RepID=A0A150WZL3_ROSEK|nr:hypothetical protein MB14_10470 [Roseivirga ehrenbergii]